MPFNSSVKNVRFWDAAQTAVCWSSSGKVMALHKVCGCLNFSQSRRENWSLAVLMHALWETHNCHYNYWSTACKREKDLLLICATNLKTHTISVLNLYCTFSDLNVCAGFLWITVKKTQLQLRLNRTLKIVLHKKIAVLLSCYIVVKWTAQLKKPRTLTPLVHLQYSKKKSTLTCHKMS